MRKGVSLIVVIIAVAVVWYLYGRNLTSMPGGENPRATVDVVGVRADLINIARAERGHFARNNSYASLDDLRSSGDLTIGTNGRYGYTYSVSYTDTHFTVEADRTGPDTAGPAKITVDDAMNVSQE
jgi:Tfp pilus assembly protein PilE